jgi:putative hydrolase of the HAD superfamily
LTQSVYAVLFDLDNTLYDRDKAFAEWANWFVRDRLGLVNQFEIEKEVDFIVRQDAHGIAPLEDRLQGLKARYSTLTEPLAEFMDAYRRQLLDFLPRLDDDTNKLLDALEVGSVPFGIVTNGAPSQLDKIRRLGLDTRASVVLVSEILGVRKPDPEIFLAAANEVGKAPCEILFVGDHPAADIGGALGAGMQAAWLRRGREWPQELSDRAPNYIIDSLAELMWIVESHTPNLEHQCPTG